MNTREAFDSLNRKILSFVESSGGCVRQSHVERLFPESGTRNLDFSKPNHRNINYMVKKGRLFKLDGGLLATERDAKAQSGKIAVIGVLCDLHNKVENYYMTEYPVPLTMISKTGELFEVVYVRRGDEAGVQASLSVMDKGVAKGAIPKRIVVLEDESQLNDVEIVGAVRYGVMQKDGTMAYGNK